MDGYLVVTRPRLAASCSTGRGDSLGTPVNLTQGDRLLSALSKAAAYESNALSLQSDPITDKPTGKSYIENAGIVM